MGSGPTDAVFVVEDADPARLARGLACGLRLNGGVTGIAPRRVFLPRSQASEVEERIGVEIGNLPAVAVDQAAADFAREPMVVAVRNGARIACGAPGSGGRVKPPVPAAEDPHGRILREDVFAPALSLIGVDGPDEALHLDGASP